MASGDSDNIATHLGVRPGLRIWVGGHNLSARREIERHLAGTLRPPTGPIDLALIAPNTPDEAAHFAGKLRGRLGPGGRMCAVIPTDDTGWRRDTNTVPNDNTMRSSGHQDPFSGLAAVMRLSGYGASGTVRVCEGLVCHRFEVLATKG